MCWQNCSAFCSFTLCHDDRKAKDISARRKEGGGNRGGGGKVGRQRLWKGANGAD